MFYIFLILSVAAAFSLLFILWIFIWSFTMSQPLSPIDPVLPKTPSQPAQLAPRLRDLSSLPS